MVLRSFSSRESLADLARSEVRGSARFEEASVEGEEEWERTMLERDRLWP